MWHVAEFQRTLIEIRRRSVEFREKLQIPKNQITRRSVELREKLQSQFLLRCWLAEPTNVTAFLKTYTETAYNVSIAWFYIHYMHSFSVPFRCTASSPCSYNRLQTPKIYASETLDGTKSREARPDCRCGGHADGGNNRARSGTRG